METIIEPKNTSIENKLFFVIQSAKLWLLWMYKYPQYLSKTQKCVSEKSAVEKIYI